MTQLTAQAGPVFFRPTDPPWDGRPDPKYNTGLSPAVETALLDAWRLGRDESARTRLIAAWMPMAASAAQKIDSVHISRNRRQATAVDAMLHIIDRMPARGFGAHGSLARLHTYVATSMKNRIIDAIRAATGVTRSPARQGGHTVRWHDHARTGYTFDETVADANAVRADAPSGAKRITALFDAASLSEKERLLVLNELEGGSSRELVDGGVFRSKAAVSRARKKALRQLADAARQQNEKERSLGL